MIMAVNGYDLVIVVLCVIGLGSFVRSMQSWVWGHSSILEKKRRVKKGPCAHLKHYDFNKSQMTCFIFKREAQYFLWPNM